MLLGRGDDLGRNIVVFADGTGNSAAKAFKTNVWRLYQALDLTGADQIAVFSDGVGTSQFKPFEIIGLALGFGVKRRVLALYKFLCLNYQDGDRIFAFGFSRGAFTIRVLVGMIAREGLVNFKTEEELDRNARAAYRSYRPKAFPAWQPWVVFARYAAAQWFALWNEITGSRDYNQVKPRTPDPRSADDIQVAFVGVWDTVSAYGLPVDELTKAVDKWVWPITFERRTLLEPVQCARQAFSIDDERRTFFPIPWNELIPAKKAEPAAGNGEAAAADKKIPDPRLKQVWFAGCHSNVGGGYPDDRLAHIPLCWMIGEATEQGLRFKPETVADYWDYASDAGRIYDSRSGVSVFYRYHPRPVKTLMGEGVRPLVDASVITRMAKGADDYAPVSLPEHIDVLTPRGARIPFNGVPAGVPAPAGADIVDKLPLPDDRQRDLVAMERKFHGALDQLQKNSVAASTQHIGSRTQRMQLMLDTVWWRRGLYYVLLSIVLLFLAFPLFVGNAALDITSQFDQSARGIVGPIFGLISGFLPGFVSPWVDAMTKGAVAAGILAALLVTSLWVNSVLRTRINDRARSAWNVNAGRNATALQTNRNDAHRRTSLIGTVGLGIGALAMWFGGHNYTSWGFAAVTLGFLGTYVVLTSRGPRTGNVPTPVSLRIARAIRTDPRAQRLYENLREYVLPAAFLALSIGLVLCVVNKATFEVADSMGKVCPEPKGKPDGAEHLSVEATPFTTKDPCTDTLNWLQEGGQYEVTISNASGWKDGPTWDGKTLCADTRGVSDWSLAHYSATLLKRWWAQPYFKPIARVGRFGNEEYVLDPVDVTLPKDCSNTILVAEIKPKMSGELYVYVNDAVLAVPSWGKFYDNNEGSGMIKVRRVTHLAPDPVDQKCDEAKGGANCANASPSAPAPGNTGQQ